MSTKLGTKRYLRYTPHVVSFIDILGFRDLILQRSPNFISWAIRQVQQITVPDAKTNKQYAENYVNFSDLIVHTISLEGRTQNDSEQVVLSEIKHIALVQAALIEKGLLLRGAITVGQIERSYGVLFGPGLISAYELERDYAQYPRIVIENQLLKSIESKASSEVLANSVTLDDDGLIFINYLGFMQSVMANDSTSYHWLVEMHKKLIDKNLLKFQKNQRVLSKYLWLRKYHNAIVRATIAKRQQNTFYIEGPPNNSHAPSLTPSLKAR